MAIATVGSNSRDYVDINAWVASLPATLTEQEVAELYADTEFTSSSTQSITGITTTASFNIVVRAATGESFNDTEQALRYDGANGVAIRRTASYGSGALSIGVRYTVLEDLQMAVTGTTNSTGLIVGSSGDDVVVSNCLIESASNTKAVQVNGNPVDFINCVIIANDGGALGAEGVLISYGLGNFYNCTIFTNYPSSTAFGIEKQGGSANGSIVKNCAIFAFGTVVESGTWGTGTDYNATDDTSFPVGSNNVVSLTTSSQFKDVASEATLDLRAVSTGGLKAGTPDATNTSNLDIFGNARDLTTPYIGAYEVAGGTDTIVTATSQSLVLTPTKAAISVDTSVTATSQSLILTPTNTIIDINSDTIVTATSQSLILSPTNTIINVDTSITATSQSLILTPTNTIVAVDKDITVTATNQNLILSPTNTTVSVNSDTIVTATSQSLILTPSNTTVLVTGDTIVTATNQSLLLSPTNTFVVTPNITITANSQSLVLTPTNASVTVYVQPDISQPPSSPILNTKVIVPGRYDQLVTENGNPTTLFSSFLEDISEKTNVGIGTDEDALRALSLANQLRGEIELLKVHQHYISPPVTDIEDKLADLEEALLGYIFAQTQEEVNLEDYLPLVGGTLTGTLQVSNTAATISSGSGTPESSVTAPIGSMYTRTDGGASTTLYIKESGVGNTGWIAK